MRRFLLALLVSVTLPGCADSAEVRPASAAELPTVDDETRQRISREILGAMEGWLRVAARLNEESSFAPFSQSAETLTAWDGEVADVAGYRTFWVEAVSTLSAQEFADLNTRVQVLTPDVAVATSTAHWSRVDKEGRRSAPMPWTATATWVREAAEWKVINLHQSISGEVTPIQ
jgi:hypothetical protein